MSTTEQRTGRGRRVRTVLSRTASGVAVLALAGVAAAAGTIGDAPEPVAVDPVLVEVQPPPTELVCPGPVRLPTEQDADDSLAYDPAFDPAPSISRARLVAVSVAPGGDGPPALGGLRTLGESPESATPFDVGGAGSGSSGVGTGVGEEGDLDRATVLRAEAAGDRPAWVAGAVAAHTADGDLRGSAAASCQRPSTEAWLVGGGTRLGSSARLVLQNPGRTPATVEITLWGPNGPVEVAGAPQYLVPAGTERAVLLEGVAAEQQRVVVRVTASGGQVTAYLQDSRLRGFVPDGVDYVVAGQGPGLRQVVPGVAVTDRDDASGGGGSEGGVTDGRGTVLRLLAPDQGTTAEVAFVGSDGIVELPGAQSVPLEAGVVIDVPLGDLPPDVYTVVVTAEQPVVAGAMIIRTASGADDVAADELPAERAWVASASAGTAGPLALPAGSAARLLMAVVPETGSDAPDGPGGDDGAVPDPSGTDVTVEVIGVDGSTLAEHEQRLTTGRTTLLDPADLVADDEEGIVGVVLRTDDPRVVWSAVLASPSAATSDFVSVLLPVPPAPDQPTVPVRVR